ncbi:hypothetical protein DM01DRAFT_1178851 [Hesseltinella vesiculosa]|uniref:Gfd2/YDR514C-like C-terminal domain-containing protein n=1 Tax=Hesseltinella vesiculosa TaxID=101127 RepID=A0A1X2G4J5_9FUNG|nr:hypothetical protein DM01DRAFT_1178851 [Hesseltinella vesiculosa]
MQNENAYTDLERLKDTWVEPLRSELSKAFYHFFKPDNLFHTDSPCHMMPLFLCVPLSTADFGIYIQTNHAQQLAQILATTINLPSAPAIPHHLVVPSSALESNMTTFHMRSGRDFLNLKKKVKQAKKQRERHVNAYESWDRASRLLAARQYVFISLDIEAYEADHSILLEIGWSMYDSRLDRYMDQHYMIDQYRHLANGKYVSDERLHFQFGTSVWSSLKQALEELYKDMAWATQRDGSFVLVGHGLDSDLRYLGKAGFKWPAVQAGHSLSVDFSYPLATHGVTKVEDSAVRTIINTETLYGVHKNDLLQPSSLGKCLVDLDIPYRHLHNAGNDAHYTMALMKLLLDLST